MENIPTNNSRYQFYDLLGTGGVGEVRKGFDLFFRREIALKILRRDCFTNDFYNWFVPRFVSDSQAISQLAHPNFCNILDFSTVNNVPFWVMDIQPDGSFSRFIGQQIPYTQAAMMLLPVADALALAHQNGIFHGNLKPTNILWSANQTPIISDTGITHYLSENGHGFGAFEASAGIGSPDYLAPEQGYGRKIDGRTDVYSLGIILYEMITGRKPFAAISPLEIMAKQVNEPLPSPRYFTQNITPQVEQILYQATSKQPENRISSMGEFALMLRGIATDQNLYGNAAFNTAFNTSYNPYNTPKGLGGQLRLFFQRMVAWFRESLTHMIIGVIGVLILLLLIILGLVSGSEKRTASIDATNTQAVVEIFETQSALETQLYATSEENRRMTQEAETAAAVIIPTQPVFSMPTITAVPASTLAPTAAPQDAGRYQSQSPADGTNYVFGEAFTVTWNIENTGSTTWTTDYTLNYLGGTNFASGAITSVNVPVETWPGGATGISIPAVAPLSAGQYEMKWGLTNPTGGHILTVTISINAVDGVLTATPTLTLQYTETPTATPTPPF